MVTEVHSKLHKKSSQILVSKTHFELHHQSSQIIMVNLTGELQMLIGFAANPVTF